MLPRELPGAGRPLLSEALAAPEPRFVFEPLRYWADVDPERAAVVGVGVEWTYGELERRTNQLARAIRARGVGAGDRVAFVLPRGPRAVLTLVAVLKAGAAYVPLDAQTPPARIRECLEDARPSLVLTEPETARYLQGEECLLDLSALLETAESEAAEPISHGELGLDHSHLAYIIFTSGTTGRPKGVPIRHESLTNFVVGNQETCIRLMAEDRVLQAFSPASDGHHEEVWPTFLAGARLVVATAREVYSGLELGAFLRDHAVTVVSCAPTLLAMVDDDVPSLRRILFGAEHLPASVVQAWWQPGREILNTYGPTEATVGATFGRCRPGEPVTIGQPLPGYHCYLLDDTGAEAEEGELCIAGIGVSDGYFGRSDLSAGRFVPNPFAHPEAPHRTLYRTGDLVRRDGEGNFVWLGRIDSQVKIRGHRIEVSEIEARLLEEPSVRAAVVTARQVTERERQLVALIVPRDPAGLDLPPLLERLRGTLPGYMVPASFELIDRVPVLPSGKVDRRTCETLQGRAVRIEREIVPPRTDLERKVTTMWRELFHDQEISCTDDFFTDLGGYSLLASRFVSEVRREARFSGVSVLDLYENPTARGFAALLERQSAHQTEAAPRREFEPVPAARYYAATAIQAVAILVLFGVQGFFWLGPILAAVYFSNNGFGDWAALGLALVGHAVSVPLFLLLTVAVKWAVGGRFRAGSTPLWGAAFLRWWFVHRFMAIAPVVYLTGTPLASVYLRALGARIGRNVTFESLDVDCPDLLEVGDDCSFENSSWTRAAHVADGMLTLRPIQIAAGCTVGVRSGVSGGAVMERGAALQDLTLIREGDRVPAGEEWAGSPARRAARPVLPAYEPGSRPKQGRLLLFGAAQALLLGVLGILDALPFTAIAFWLYGVSEGPDYALGPLFAVVLFAVTCVQAVAVKWLVLGRLREGTYPYPGGTWLRKWFAEKHLELLSGTIVPIYDSLLARPWCRLLGMQCGPWCEIALPRWLPYDLVEMGAESFLASEVSVGMPIRRNGTLTLARTRVGERVFLGNDSVVPQGARVPDRSLLGVLSVSPPNERMGGETDQAWLGSPAFRMPNREQAGQFTPEQTYRPTRKVYLHRLGHELFRLILPPTCSLLSASVFIEAFAQIWNERSLGAALASVPLLYLMVALLGALMVKAAKWVLVGRYARRMEPLWSPFVWKVETYSAVLHDFGVPLFVVPLVGTPFMAAFMRFLGARVGRRAFLDSTDFTETDLIEIGDDAAINSNAPLQAHLFEDRVMKMGPIRVGKRCTVGHHSVILCESVLHDDCRIGDLSLVMKGETVPRGTAWAGSPAQADPRG